MCVGFPSQKERCVNASVRGFVYTVETHRVRVDTGAAKAMVRFETFMGDIHSTVEKRRKTQVTEFHNQLDGRTYGKRFLHRSRSRSRAIRPVWKSS